jgi:O-antigen/teichoic acid export membrane protein
MASSASPREARSAPAGGAFVRGSAFVFGAILLWHASNFVFNSVSARVLGPSDYGTLAAVIALVYLASPVFLSVQTVASRITTRLGTKGEWARIRGLAGYYNLRMAFVGMLFAGVIALSSRILATVLHFPSGLPIALLGLSFPLGFVTHVQRGVLQGSQQFGRYAASTVLEAVVKIAGAILLVAWLWASVEAAVVSILIASAVALAANHGLLGFLPRAREHRPILHPYGYSLMTLTCLILLALLFSVDMLAAKRYLDPEVAGLYAVASLSGKVVFFATSALNWVMFPVFSARQEKGQDSRKQLLRVLSAVLGASAVVTIIYFVAPSIVITPLFGSRYAVAGPYIGWMAIAITLYAVAYLITLYLLSQRVATGASVLGIVELIQLAGLSTFHASIGQLIAVQISVMGMAAAALGALAFHIHPRSAEAKTVEPRLLEAL